MNKVAPVAGDKYYNVDSSAYCTYNGTSWRKDLTTINILSTPVIVASNYISTQTSAQTISTYTTGAADSSYSISAYSRYYSIVC